MLFDGFLEGWKTHRLATAQSPSDVGPPTLLGRRLGVRNAQRAPTRRDGGVAYATRHTSTGVLVHDINNLLNVVLAANEALALQLPDGSEACQLAETGLGAVERAAELLARLLDLSAPKPEAAPSCDGSEAALAVARQARFATPASVSVEVRIADAPLACLVDRVALEAALLNLCVNAGHAMPNGGAIVITAEAVTLGASSAGPAAGDYVALSVMDNGTGMSPEVLARAPEPYFTTRAGRGGTGLGLASVQAFALQAAGRLDLRSQEGRGTTATLYVPRATAPGLSLPPT